MRAGNLRRQVTLQSRRITQDSYGTQSTVWDDVATLWAGISALSGRELLAAQAIQTEITHEITVRYSSLFADPKTVAAMRFVYNNRIFNIHDCRNTDEKNWEILMLCSEGLNQG